MYKAIQAVNNKNNYTAVLLDANELSNLQIREVNIPVLIAIYGGLHCMVPS